MKEEWKEIKGYEGYFVSNLGRVKGLYGKVLKPQLNPKTGYYHVNVRKNGKQRTNAIHRLVAEAFLSPVDGKPQVNHKDGDKTNNNIDNLEWVSASENRKHAYSKGLFDESKIRQRGLKGGEGALKKLGKPVILTDKDGNEYHFDSVRQACEELNLDRKSLSGVLKGKKSHYTVKGYKARYK